MLVALVTHRDKAVHGGVVMGQIFSTPSAFWLAAH